MDRAAIEARVIAITSERAGIPADQITLATRIFPDLNIDTLDVVELVMEVEEQFGIAIPDSAGERLISVGHVVAFVERELKNRELPGA